MALLKTIVILVVLGIALAHPNDKIDTKLKNIFRAKSGAKVNIIITMRETNAAVLSIISKKTFQGRTERLDGIHKSLQGLAAQTQRAIRHFLTSNEYEFQSFWINNKIFVSNADESLVQRLATFYEISEIYPEHIVDKGTFNGSQWIACRGCTSSFCSERDLLACGEFMTCPTDASGQNPDCSKAPNLVSNSWEGGQGATWYKDVIAVWVAGGIVPLFSQ